jgi:hypothetical protein
MGHDAALKAVRSRPTTCQTWFLLFAISRAWISGQDAERYAMPVSPGSGRRLWWRFKVATENSVEVRERSETEEERSSGSALESLCTCWPFLYRQYGTLSPSSSTPSKSQNCIHRAGTGVARPGRHGLALMPFGFTDGVQCLAMRKDPLVRVVQFDAGK